MTQISPLYWDPSNNKGWSQSTDELWALRTPQFVHFPYTIPFHEPPHMFYTSQTPEYELCYSSNLWACGVCRRRNCQLRSHRAYLSARQGSSSRASIPTHDVGMHYPCYAKPKPVDDKVIRAAFTKSYAFIEPSHLSTLQPSSFRLDGFHDLPVSNGNHPEMHKLLWDFLNNHLEMILGKQLQQGEVKLNLHDACLAAAMSDANVCLCLLATEKLIQDLLRERSDVAGSRPMSTNHFQRCLDFIQLHPIDFRSKKSIGESIISLCLRLVLEIQRGVTTTTTTTKSLESAHDHGNYKPNFDMVMASPDLEETNLLTFESP